MPLEHPKNYVIPDEIRYTQSEEEKVIKLLKDVKGCVSLLRPEIENQRLDAILEIVEDGKWILQDLNVLNRKAIDSIKQVKLNYNIDLSQAKQLVDKYRHNSEGGCQSCLSRKVYSPMQGESFTYCSKREDENFAAENWNLIDSQSPTIKEFHKTGCDDKEVIIQRKLEDVLDDSRFK